MHLNSGSQEQKNAEINSIIYKPMVEKNLLALLFKVFAKNKDSKLDMLYRIYIQKNKIAEQY